MEKKWTAIPRLQKKVLELERVVAQNAKIHAHRVGGEAGGANGSSVQRRMLPRLPCSHTLQGHAASVTCVQVHPVFTVVVSGSEDGTIKVRALSTTCSCTCTVGALDSVLARELLCFAGAARQLIIRIIISVVFACLLATIISHLHIIQF